MSIAAVTEESAAATVLWSYLAEVWNAMQAAAALRERAMPHWPDVMQLFARAG